MDYGGKGLKEKEESGSEKLPMLSGLAYSAYRILGRGIGPLYPLFKDLKPTLVQSGLKIGYKPYVSLILFLLFLSTVVSSVFFSVLFFFMPPVGLFSDPFFRLLMILVLQVVTSVATFCIAYAFPSIVRSKRRERIEEFLPYTANYMAVLACAGVSPDRILRSTAMRDPKYVLSDEVKLIVGKMDLLGYDILSAISSEVNRSPSAPYSNLFRGFAATTRSGGDLKKFLLDATRFLMRRKSRRLREFLDTLSLLGETYVALLIVFPLFLIIMFSMMAMIGGSVFGMDVSQLMYFIAFGLIPILGVIFLLLIDMLQPKG